MRLRLDLAYDGTDFSGWAAQPGRRTVQGELEHWIGRVLRLPAPPALVVAGRTDAGVHATGQVCHLDLPDDLALPVRESRRPPGADADPSTERGSELAQLLAHRLRRVLPDDIAVAAVAPAPDTFDARFSALWRRYRYLLWDDAAVREPVLRRRVGVVRGVLDVERMNTAADALLGLHDFAAFCRPREGATTVRTLRRLRAERDDAGTVEVTVVADAFCHSMVRSLMGALTRVGLAAQDEDWLSRLLGASGRDSTVPVLAASGLTLVEVGYPAEDEYAARAALARRRRDEPGNAGTTGGRE